MNATHLAQSTIRQLIELGVRDFVLSPGSRNAPLSIALNKAHEKGLINLHIRIDERGAAYFALGASKASDNYVALICTSGTAAANYHPAALEAHHSNNKLIFITADRPARLRKTGANQTTLQSGILAPLESIDTADLIDCSKFLTGGPVHLNLQFDEPLIEESSSEWLDGIKLSDHEPHKRSGLNLQVDPQSVIVIGHDRAGFDPEDVRSIVSASSLPVIAEDPLSFPTAIPHASLFLADPELRKSFAAKQVIVIGRTTLSRSINAFVARTPSVVVIDPRTATVDTNREAKEILLELPKISTGKFDEQWLERWQKAGKAAESEITLNWSEQLFAREVTKLLPNDSALFIGSSRPVRDIEAFAAPRSGLKVFANRGLAGIDGNISTAQGIATQIERTYSILGDLTFLHDLSALVNSSAHSHTVYIVDNNGGGIFSTLPQAGVDGFDKIFGTPHNLNIESIIKGFGYSVEKIKSVSDLERTINRSGLHFVIVEVPTREENAAALKAIHQRVASAVRIGSNLA